MFNFQNMWASCLPRHTLLRATLKTPSKHSATTVAFESLPSLVLPSGTIFFILDKGSGGVGTWTPATIRPQGWNLRNMSFPYKKNLHNKKILVQESWDVFFPMAGWKTYGFPNRDCFFFSRNKRSADHPSLRGIRKLWLVFSWLYIPLKKMSKGEKTAANKSGV